MIDDCKSENPACLHCSGLFDDGWVWAGNLALAWNTHNQVVEDLTRYVRKMFKDSGFSIQDFRKVILGEESTKIYLFQRV